MKKCFAFCFLLAALFLLLLAACAINPSPATSANLSETTSDGSGEGQPATSPAESGGNSLEMTSGNFAGSRLGLKCSEDLGNGLSVGFILENGSSSDSGALGKDGSIFNRESQIYLKTRFGTSRLA